LFLLRDLHSQSRPEFRRYGATYERRHVTVPESASIDFDNIVQETTPTIVQETTPTISDDSGSIPILSPIVDPPDPSIDLPIALRKGNRSTSNPYPIYNFLSYYRLSPLHHAFVSAVSTISIPKTVKEALSHPGWRQAMIDEMNALESSSTRKLVPLPHGKSKVGCRWVFAIKVGPDG